MLQQTARSTLFPYTTLFRSLGEGLFETMRRSNQYYEDVATRAWTDTTGTDGVVPELPTVRSVTSTEGSFSEIAGVAQRELCTIDRKSTRLNSSHRCISYAVF